jgi:hypothetical protein
VSDSVIEVTPTEGGVSRFLELADAMSGGVGGVRNGATAAQLVIRSVEGPDSALPNGAPPLYQYTITVYERRKS